LGEQAILAIIVVSCLLQLGIFIAFSIVEKTAVNVLVYSFLVGLPINFILPFFRIQLLGPSGSTFGYLVAFFTLNLMTACLIAGYWMSRKVEVRLFPAYAKRCPPIIVACFFVVSILLYLPILRESSISLANPADWLLQARETYKSTRQGYGLFVFGSELLLLSGVVLALFSTSLRRQIVVCAFACCLCLLFGSKRNVVVILCLLLLHSVYISGHRISFSRFLPIATVAVTLLLAFFYFASFGQAARSRDGRSQARALFERVVNYSDLTDNVVMVIDHCNSVPIAGGRIAWEQWFWGRIPRKLYPAKPEVFGVRRIASEFFPEEVSEEYFSPNFGIGIEFRDWGMLAVPLLAMFSFAKGAFLRVVVTSCSSHSDIGSFVVLAFLCGVPVLGIGGVNGLLLENYLIGLSLGLGALACTRLRYGKTKGRESRD